MRVVVATGPIGRLESRAAGSALARAWAGPAARPEGSPTARPVEVAVVPIGEVSNGFPSAWRDLFGAEPYARGAWLARTPDGLRQGLVEAPEASREVPPGPESAPDRTREGSTRALGEALVPLLNLGLDELVIPVDWSQECWHDGGAGLLAALGAVADVPLDQGVAGLAGITRLDLAPAREALGPTRLVLVTTSTQAGLHLTGLRGITSVWGHAGGADPALMLADDQALVDLAAAAGASSIEPGSGAAGGLGFAIQALGGRVLTGPQHCAERAGLPGTLRQADLVVAGYDQLDFGSKGGDLLPLVADLAAEAMRPVVVVARTNHISARELRTMGIETAHALCPDNSLPSAEQLTELARPVARTWSW